jgi:hypothetical protein
MTRFENKVFANVKSFGKTVCADMEFVKCQFAHCSATDAGVSDRCTIRNLRLVNCSQETCALTGPILQNVVVDGLKTRGEMLTIYGGFFDKLYCGAGSIGYG